MPSARPKLEIIPVSPGQRWAPTVRTYAHRLATVLDNLPVDDVGEAIELLVDSVLNDRQVFILGNGGSAATASHLALDLQKGTRLRAPLRMRALALVDSAPAMTAYANDVDYESALALQLNALACQDDVVIAISASGMSPNVLRAVEAAHRRGCHVIAMSGMGGGELAPAADVAVTVPSDDMELVEDAHMTLAHTMVRAVRHHFAGRR